MVNCLFDFKQSKEFTLVDSLKLNNHYLETLNFTNQLDCFQICRQNEDCKAASFHRVSSKNSCLLFKTDLSSKEEVNWISYLKKPNNFTHRNPNNFKIINNLRLSNHFSTNNVSSELECFKVCVSNTECKAASYSFETFKSECFLFKTGFTSKEENHWITYIKIGKITLRLKNENVWI